jgi:hypothetical protein
MYKGSQFSFESIRLFSNNNGDVICVTRRAPKCDSVPYAGIGMTVKVTEKVGEGASETGKSRA